MSFAIKDLLDTDKINFKEEKTISKTFFNGGIYTVLDNIPEIFCEWWSHSKKDIHTFLEDENLSQFISDNTFTDILLGKYYFSDHFLMLLSEKFSSKITLPRLHALNKKFARTHSNATELKVDKNLIIDFLKKRNIQKKKERTESIAQWHKDHKKSGAESSKRYRESHKEKIKAYKKVYNQTHKEENKAYKASRREIENEQQRIRYHKNPEKSREQNRLYQRKYRQEDPEKYRARDAKYRAEHREEINERARKRLENEETHQKKIEKDRAYYAANSAVIQAKKTQKRLENLEQALEQERIYGQTYRNKNRSKINARSRERYQEDLPGNRKKNAEKMKAWRQKKRFKTETGKMIFPLLDAVIQSKLQR